MSDKEDKKTKHTKELMKRISDLCKLLGWNIAIPSTGEEVPGMILGTDDYIESVLGDDSYDKSEDIPPNDVTH